MRAKDDKDGCRGCDISREREKVVGGIVRLDGKWILNHYQQEDQGFLGWLALQPKYHRMEWEELTRRELKTLGPNITRVKQALREYWQKHFSADCVKRVYVTYLFESPFDEPPGEYHLHIHLIPRFAKLDSLLREPTKAGSRINAWKLYKLREEHENEFPEEYGWDGQRIEALMKELRNLL
jgi:diadenosine tetraphosphate (Ap4A) HIT family hydrolase